MSPRTSYTLDVSDVCVKGSRDAEGSGRGRHVPRFLRDVDGMILLLYRVEIFSRKVIFSGRFKLDREGMQPMKRWRKILEQY